MTHSIITSDQEKITYNVTIPEGGKEIAGTVLLLHGLGGDLSVWKELEKMLAKQGFRSISLDQRGHGQSSRPKTSNKYSFDRLALDAVEVLDAEGLKQAQVVGHCLGAIVAQQVAINHPERVEQLALLAPTHRTWSWVKYLNSIGLFSSLGDKIIAILPGQHYARRYADVKHWDGKTDFSGRRLLGDFMRTSLKSYGGLLLNVLKLNLTEQLHLAKTVPVIIFMGKHDHIISSNIVEEYRSYLPEAEIHVLENANHQLLFNGFHEMTDQLIPWLKKN